MSNLKVVSFNKNKREREEKIKDTSFLPPNNDDGAIEIDFNGVSTSTVSFTPEVKSDVERINLYRQMARHHNIDDAIQDITNEVIVVDDDMEDGPVNLDLNKTKFSESIKNKIYDEFDTILDLLEFNKKGDEIFRKWYVDSRLAYHKAVDKGNMSKGIKKLVKLDPRNLQFVREIKKSHDEILAVKDYYIYDENIHLTKGKQNRPSVRRQFQLDKETVSFIHSGIIDEEENNILGFLDKAIKPWNQLNMMEDSGVIYRMVRAPERRVFYIDVGSLPTKKSMEYLNSVKNKYSTKMRYDPVTGSMKNQSDEHHMLENYWLPRREGGRGTEIDTLPGGQNLGEIEDINYFLRKMYKSLNVPVSRLDSEASFNFGRDVEITRDELKFSKFIKKLRNKFSGLFEDLLHTQLILKKIITEDEWVENRNLIMYIFNQDIYVTEQKNIEMMNDRLDLAEKIDPYVGRYFSEEYVRSNVLNQTEKEIESENKKIEEEMPEEEPEEPEEKEPKNNAEKDLDNIRRSLGVKSDDGEEAPEK